MMNEKNHSLYEKFTSVYELFFRPFFVKGMKITMATLEKNKHEAVLEVGCGTGYSFEYYPPGLKVTAYDISDKMGEKRCASKPLAFTPKRRSQDILDNEILVLDSENYYSYLKGKTFDAVISFSVMSVVPDPQVFLEELRIRCKRGGYIYLVMHSRSKGFGRLLEYIFEFPCRFLLGFTLLRRIEDLDISGLEIVENRKIKFLFFTLNNLIVLKKRI